VDIREATSGYERWLKQCVPLLQGDLDLKHRLMAADVFSFLRATFYRWSQLWPELCAETTAAPRVLAVGDLHVENFGTWRDAEGRLIWGVNDFDETATLPYTQDLVRLATSALMAVEESRLTLSSRGELPPELPSSDPLDDATVLLIGRGRCFPALSVTLGERVGLIGALSVESAARTLNARDIDGIVIGDGFGPRIVEALLTVFAEDVRFRDLPVAVLGGHPATIEPFFLGLPNLERTAEGPERLVERFMPYVRVHAFGQRLRRMLKSLDAHGMVDPDTGLLANEAFWRDLNRAVDDAEKRGIGLSIARFSFAHANRRLSVDAARVLSRLMRQVDFACREADNSIFAVFTETDLREAHVIARRIASVLKNTMLAPEKKQIDAAVTLATLKANDNVDSLIARVVGEAPAR